MEDFLKEWTETARIAESSISPEPVYKDSYAHIASGEDVLITYKLINPQNYELNGNIAWSGEVSAEQGAGYTLAQDAGDRSLFYLTLKNSFLETLDGKGTDISPTLTITEPRSGRNFGSYTVPALVNSAPPAVILPVVLSTGGTAGNGTYVICFNLPDMTGIHRDITTLKIGSPYEKTYTVNADGALSGGDGVDNWEIKTEYDNSWEKVSDAEFIGDKNKRFVGIVTDVPLSDNLTTFTLTLTDRSGLSTSVTASTQAPKLDSVTASPKGGTIETGGTVTFKSPVPEADIVLISDNWTGVKKDGTGVSEEIKEKGSITLTFTTAGTYNITAYATMSGAANSDKVTFTYKVVDSAVYVSETGSNSNPGTENKPVATLQKAIELLNEAQFNEGKIVVMGTVKTGEVKINTSDDTAGSLKTLTVRGGAGGGTLENESGRVFTIGSGGSLTLGENITLTGTVTGDNGGAVYVAGGTFTMEADSKITGSSASYGGGVYVMNGTFTMEGGTITGNNAMHGGGVRMDSGEFIMKDGTISDNSATNLGGGVCVINGSFTMEGGTIGGTDAESANTADYGGGVYMNGGEFTMSGSAKIRGNEATGTDESSGGGVYVNGGEFTMSDGTISGNTAATNGGGVYVNGSFTVSGTPTITGNTAIGDNNVYLPSGKTITIGEGGLTGGTIGVTAEKMEDDIAILSNVKSAGQCRFFKLSEAIQGSTIWWIECNLVESSGILKSTTAASVSENKATVSDGINSEEDLQDWMEASASAGVEVEITGGVTINISSTVSVPDGADVTIKPDSGKSVNITASGKTTIFDVQDGGNLILGGGGGEVNVSGDLSASPPESVGDEKTLINISSGGAVTIEKNANIQNNQAGRGVTVTDGTLIMTGGSIKGNTGGYYYGSGVYVSGENAKFEMSGGEISDNTLELNTSGVRQGTGVTVTDGATFILAGNGKIINNTGYEGVGVSVRDNSIFNMTGGEISGNYGTGTSGGVFITGGTMYMTGGKITGNKCKWSSNAGAGLYFQYGTFDGTGAANASITGNYCSWDGTNGTEKDVYVKPGGGFNKGNVTVGVGP